MWNKILRYFQPKSVFKTLPAYNPTVGEYIDQRYFVMTVVAAVGLHMLAVYAWGLMPKTEVIDIPVRALSIKLGDGEPLPDEALVQPADAPKADVQNALSSSMREATPDVVMRAKPVQNTIDKAVATPDKENATKAFDKAISNTSAEASAAMQESVKKLSNIARQFVRTNAAQAPAAKGGSTLGNSTAKEAELMSRYEQLISLWIEKFKQYPEDARAQGMQGETVVRIRIDRQGNIRYYILERSTGFQALDRAAIDMVKRANPVPAVPNDYPPGDLIEFLIPVNFHLQ